MMRFAFPRLAAIVFVCLLAAAPAAAQEPSTRLRGAIAAAVAELGSAQQSPPAPLPAGPPAAWKRPAPLVPLYISFATLQVLDAHSTRRALTRGAVEANPLMKGVAGNSGALLAVKVAGAAATIVAADKISKKNKAAAVAFMVAVNAGMALVVRHNYRAVR
jgi:hypothetical protein